MSTALGGLDLALGVAPRAEAAAVAPGASEELRRRFEAQALPHLRSLYGAALSMTGNAADAEDLVQEVLLRGFRAFDGYAPAGGSGVREWLHGLLHRTGRETARLRECSDEAARPWALRGRPDRVAGSGAGRDLERALGSLPDILRATLVLRDRQDFTCEEIARIVGVPVATVIQRLHRARAFLGQALQRPEAALRARRLEEVM